MSNHTDHEAENAAAVLWQNRKMTMTFCESNVTDGHNHTRTWKQLVYGASLVSAFKKHREQDDKNRWGLVPAQLRDDRPGVELYPDEMKVDASGKKTVPKNVRNENIKEIHALVYDFDDAGPCDVVTAKLRASSVSFLGYSSYNHLRKTRPGSSELMHKFRVVIPLLKPLTIRENCKDRDIARFKRLYAKVPMVFEMSGYDAACARPSHLFYLPAHDGSEEAKSVAFIDTSCFDRLPLNVSGYLEAIDAELDREEQERQEKKRRHRERQDVNRSSDVTYRTPWLKRFRDRIGNALDVKGLIGACVQVGDERDNGNVLEVTCPNFEAHSDPNSNHHTCFACNVADTLDGEVLDHIVVSCNHNHCKAPNGGPGTWGFIDLFIDHSGMSEEEALAFVPEAIANEYRRDRNLPHDCWRDGGMIVTTSGSRRDDIITVCGDIECLGVLTDETGRNPAVELKFVRRDGGESTAIVPQSELYNPRNELAVQLAKDGLWIGTEARAKDRFLAVLNTMTSEICLIAYSKPGWHGDRYVSVIGEVIGPDGQSDVSGRLMPGKGAKRAERGGTLEGWKKSVGRHLSDTRLPHFAFAACVGVAGVIVNRLNKAGFGFYIMGPTSIGKSLSQRIQAGLWATVEPGSGQFNVCKSTANKADYSFARANGATVAFEEAKRADLDFVENFAFLCEEGVLKGRLTSGAVEKDTPTWQTVATLSGEQPLDVIIGDKKRGGKATRVGGQTVRLPTVDLSSLQPIEAVTIAEIEDGVRRDYGHVGPMFVSRLMSLSADEIEAGIQARVARLVQADGSAAHLRVARNFATVWYGGDLLAALDIFTSEAVVERAVRWAWNSFLSGSDAANLNVGDSGVDALCDFLIRHPSRIGKLGETDQRREAWQGLVAFEDDTHYYVLESALGELVGSTTTPRKVLAELFERGILLKSGDHLAHRRLPRKQGDAKHYRLLKAKLIQGDPEEAIATEVTARGALLRLASGN